MNGKRIPNTDAENARVKSWKYSQSIQHVTNTNGYNKSNKTIKIIKINNKDIIQQQLI
jgi:hypothetical protein